jgi:hypothetical protein
MPRRSDTPAKQSPARSPATGRGQLPATGRDADGSRPRRAASPPIVRQVVLTTERGARRTKARSGRIPTSHRARTPKAGARVLATATLITSDALRMQTGDAVRSMPASGEAVPAQDGRGVTSRCTRSFPGSSRISAVSTARSAWCIRAADGPGAVWRPYAGAPEARRRWKSTAGRAGQASRRALRR